MNLGLAIIIIGIVVAFLYSLLLGLLLIIVGILLTGTRI